MQVKSAHACQKTVKDYSNDAVLPNKRLRVSMKNLIFRKKSRNFFQVPYASIESIRSKLVMSIFDEYTSNIRCMYSTRFSGCTPGQGLPQKPIRPLTLPPPPSESLVP